MRIFKVFATLFTAIFAVFSTCWFFTYGIYYLGIFAQYLELYTGNNPTNPTTYLGYYIIGWMVLGALGAAISFIGLIYINIQESVEDYINEKASIIKIKIDCVKYSQQKKKESLQKKKSLNIYKAL